MNLIAYNGGPDTVGTRYGYKFRRDKALIDNP